MTYKLQHIILADDDNDDCVFFKAALESIGFGNKLTTVNDGEQLMDYLIANTETLPDILFLDINMPRKNGFECLKEIKNNNALKQLPVIMFSTTTAKVTMEKTFDQGSHIYICKPGSFKQLVQLIKHAIPIAEDQITTKSELNYILNA